jgi:hypothetical protein
MEENNKEEYEQISWITLTSDEKKKLSFQYLKLPFCGVMEEIRIDNLRRKRNKSLLEESF